MILAIIAASLFFWQASGDGAIVVKLTPVGGVRAGHGDGKPVGVRLGPAPEAVKEPLEGDAVYGTLQFAGQSYVIGVKRDPGAWKLAMDTNRDGVFGEGEVLETRRSESPAMGTNQRPVTMVSYGAAVRLNVTWEGEETPYTLVLATAEPAENSPAPKDTVVVIRDYARTGKLALNSREYDVFLDEPEVRGTFEYGGEGPSPLILLADFNGDGRFNPYVERLPIERSFRFAGKPYKVDAVNAAGTELKLAEKDDTPEFWDASTGSTVGPFTAPKLGGGMVRFPDDFRGKKVIFFFWGTWNGECVPQMRRMSFILDRYADRGMAMVGVNLDAKADEERAKARVTTDLPNAPSIFEGSRAGGPVARRLGATNIPSMIIVDADTGKILADSDEAQYTKLGEWLKRFWPDE